MHKSSNIGARALRVYSFFDKCNKNIFNVEFIRIRQIEISILIYSPFKNHVGKEMHLEADLKCWKIRHPKNILSILLLIRENTTVIHREQHLNVGLLLLFFIIPFRRFHSIRFFKQQSQSNPSVCFFFSCDYGCVIFIYKRCSVLFQDTHAVWHTKVLCMCACICIAGILMFDFLTGNSNV